MCRDQPASKHSQAQAQVPALRSLASTPTHLQPSQRVVHPRLALRRPRAAAAAVRRLNALAQPLRTVELNLCRQAAAQKSGAQAVKAMAAVAAVAALSRTSSSALA
jgi:hypothetical protein